MLRKMRWAVMLAVVLIPVALHAAVEVENLFKADIGASILDVTADPATDLVFILTPKTVVIYSTDEQAIVDRIPLEEPFDRITYQEGDRLVLTAAESSRITMIRFSRVYDIDLSGRAIKGPRDAKVTLVVFDDYQCPYCARLDVLVQQVLKDFPNQIDYAIKHFPLPRHQFSLQGAMAALAAGKQGKFWEFHSRLLENYRQVNEQKIMEIATNLGLDLERFKQDRQLAASRQLIQEDVENGKKIGVSGTPSVFLNGKRVPARDLGTLPALIMRELSK